MNIVSDRLRIPLVRWVVGVVRESRPDHVALHSRRSEERPLDVDGVGERLASERREARVAVEVVGRIHHVDTARRLSIVRPNLESKEERVAAHECRSEGGVRTGN